MIQKPRLLIAEDLPVTRQLLRAIFSAPPPHFVDAYGVGPFDVDAAATGEQALGYIREAVVKMRPYDVITLDLGLPRGDPEDPPETQVGIDILQSLQRENKWASVAVVIQSVHAELPFFVEVLRAGAADFVPKPFESETIFRSVIEAYKKARARLETAWGEYRQHRLEQWLLVQTCAQTVDRLAHIVSDGVSEILDHADQLQHGLADYYQVSMDRDPEDPLCRSLLDLRRAALATTRRCAETRAAASPGHGRVESFPLEKVVQGAIDRLRVGLAWRRLRLQGPAATKHQVYTFRADAEAIIQEMLFSAVERSEEGSDLACEVARSEDGLTMDIRVSDHAPRLDRELCDRIAEGKSLDPSAGPAWGLSPAQWVARNIGARIEIEATDGGNTVTLRLPVPAND